MTTDDGDAVVERLSGLASCLGEEGGGTDNVESGNTEEAVLREESKEQNQSQSRPSQGSIFGGKVCCNLPPGVVNALLLEDLGDDRDGRVDRVRDDKDKSLGRVLGNAYGNVTNDTGVDLCERQSLSKSPMRSDWMQRHSAHFCWVSSRRAPVRRFGEFEQRREEKGVRVGERRRAERGERREESGERPNLPFFPLSVLQRVVQEERARSDQQFGHQEHFATVLLMLGAKSVRRSSRSSNRHKGNLQLLRRPRGRVGATAVAIVCAIAEHGQA